MGGHLNLLNTCAMARFAQLGRLGLNRAKCINQAASRAEFKVYATAEERPVLPQTLVYLSAALAPPQHKTLRIGAAVAPTAPQRHPGVVCDAKSGK